MSDKDKLSNLLKQASSVLRKYKRDHWADWLSKDAEWIDNDDFYGVEHFLSALGGMGSLNDIVFHPLNGDELTEKETKSVNADFQNLLDQAYSLAKTLKRN